MLLESEDSWFTLGGLVGSVRSVIFDSSSSASRGGTNGLCPLEGSMESRERYFLTHKTVMSDAVQYKNKMW